MWWLLGTRCCFHSRNGFGSHLTHYKYPLKAVASFKRMNDEGEDERDEMGYLMLSRPRLMWFLMMVWSIDSLLLWNDMTHDIHMKIERGWSPKRTDV